MVKFRVLPGPEVSRIEMDETRAGIVANPAVSKVESGVPQLVQTNPGDGDIDSHPLHVQAVPCDVMPFSAQQAVVLG